MIILNNESKCCGCMACVNSCPTGALTYGENEKGFLFPILDQEKCIQCGACEKACHFQKEEKEGSMPIAAYSLAHKDGQTLWKSTSGGAFMALSDGVLKAGGVIVAADMGEDFTLKHQIAADRSGRDRMQGTFYTQSFLGDIYGPVKEQLATGVQVMFVGLPCQVAAVRSYLKKDYPNLLTVELLCHGVPSNGFFKEHIRFLEKTYGKKAVKYAFRTKKYGWNPSGIEEVTFADGTQVASMKAQAYKKFFHANVSLRPSCLNCQYRSQKRFADITIGDFWGVQKLGRKAPAGGLSCVLANSEKGRAAVALAKEFAEIEDFDVPDVLYRIATKLPTAKMDVEAFWNTYAQKGYAGLVKTYCTTPLKARISFELQKYKRKKQAENTGRD